MKKETLQRGVNRKSCDKNSRKTCTNCKYRKVIRSWKKEYSSRICDLSKLYLFPVNRAPTVSCVPRYFNDISEVFQLRFDCISRIAHAPPDTAFHIEKEHASGMDLRTVWYAWYYPVFRFGLVLLAFAYASVGFDGSPMLKQNGSQRVYRRYSVCRDVELTINRCGLIIKWFFEHIVRCTTFSMSCRGSKIDICAVNGLVENIRIECRKIRSIRND